MAQKIGTRIELNIPTQGVAVVDDLLDQGAADAR